MEPKTPKKYIVEKGIPIRKKVYENLYEFPFEQMKVGDSFFCDDLSANAIRCQVSGANANLNKRFVTRAERKGLRVWRTK